MTLVLKKYMRGMNVMDSPAYSLSIQDYDDESPDIIQIPGVRTASTAKRSSFRAAKHPVRSRKLAASPVAKQP